jgi:hypothetical protein
LGGGWGGGFLTLLVWNVYFCIGEAGKTAWVKSSARPMNIEKRRFLELKWKGNGCFSAILAGFWGLNGSFLTMLSDSESGGEGLKKHRGTLVKSPWCFGQDTTVI